MEWINFESLRTRAPEIRASYLAKRPYHYVSFEGFFHPAKAEALHASYPVVREGKWDSTTYIDQQNKYQLSRLPAGSDLEKAFAELNSPEFLAWVEEITGIPGLVADEELFGGGLHQSVRGAFLNVHVDYNIHPKTRLHRRLNILVYMNKEWKDEYEGHLELWDMKDRALLEKISPLFNRCVIFETNEISFHGHPKPLRTPGDVSRKSLAAYYYTKERPAEETAPEHNTIYVNTEGLRGQAKRLLSGIKAFGERMRGGR